MDGGERLAISLDFVAYYSPGAGRNLAAGFMVAAAAAEATRGRRLGLFFFFPELRVPPICLAHECAPVAAAFSTPRSFPSSGAGGFHLCPFSSSPPPARAPLLLCPPPQHTPQPPASEEAAVISFLNITFTPVWASDEKNSPSRLWISKSLRKFNEGDPLSLFSRQIPF